MVYTRIILFIYCTFFSLNSAVAIVITVAPDSEIKSIEKALEIAKDGDTVRVYEGIYREKLVIDKSISLTGINMPSIIGDGTGTIIKITAPDTEVSGFHISGSGSSLSREDSGIDAENSPRTVIQNNVLEDVLFGVYIKNSPHSTVKNNLIRGKEIAMPNRGDGIKVWYSSNIYILNNRLYDTRDLVIWWSSNTLIRGNEVRNGRYGLHYMYSNDNVFEENRFIENSVGGFLMYSNNIEFYNNVFAHNKGLASGYGIGFKDLNNVVAENNLIIDNRVGLYLDNSPHLMDAWNNIEKNVIAFNDIGVSLMPAIQRNVFTGNSFIDNFQQVQVRGGGQLKGNKWYKDGRGNYWSDYAGYDTDKDGVGDFPYIYESLFENIIDRYPSLRIFIYSPASRAIELAAEAIPVIKPRPILTDEFPLTSPYIPRIYVAEKPDIQSGMLAAAFLITMLPMLFYILVKRAGWV